MREINLSDFIELIDGRRFCILYQEMMDDRHFSLALPVLDDIEEVANILVNKGSIIIQSAILEDGCQGHRVYSEINEDYQEIKNKLYINHTGMNFDDYCKQIAEDAKRMQKSENIIPFPEKH